MKCKLIVYLCVLFCISIACDDSEDTGKISLSSIEITCEFEGGEKNFTAACPENYFVASDQVWCRVLETDELAPLVGEKSIRLFIEPNFQATERQATVTLTSSVSTAVLTVIQQGTENEPPAFVSFSFSSGNNPENLITDAVCDIKDSLITVLVPYFVENRRLVADFTYTGAGVFVGETEQKSGETENDFSKPVTYVVKNATGGSCTYKVSVSSFTGLPVVFINTEGNQVIDSKDAYVKARLKIYDNFVTRSDYGFESDVKIKGRGNTTWGLPKKPYALKFDKKTSLLGEPKDKKWVLLANYTDKTGLRNETAFYLGRLSLLDWTPRSHFVDVFVNEMYNGTYQLCEKIKISESRVNVTDDGFLLEVDQLNRLDPEDVYFRTNRILLNIKEPDVVLDSAPYNYIKEYVTEAENALYGASFTDAENGYARYLDVPSFVDWYLVNEISKNNDAVFFSSCYMNLKPGGKLKMGPIWDFDIAFGNINYNGNEDPEGFYVKNSPWISRLFEDPAFVAQVKERFRYFESRKSDIFAYINEQAVYLKRSVIENNNKWGTLYTATWPNYAVWGSYDNEVQYMKNWLDKRFEWLDAHFGQL